MKLINSRLAAHTSRFQFSMDETSAGELDLQRALSSARLPSVQSEIAFHWNKVNMPDIVSDTSKNNIGAPDAMGCYATVGYTYSRELGQCVKPGAPVVGNIEPTPPSLPSVFAPISNVCDFGAAYLCSQALAPTSTVVDHPVDSFATILDSSGVGPKLLHEVHHPYMGVKTIPAITLPVMPADMAMTPRPPAARPPAARPPAARPPVPAPVIEPAYQTIATPGGLLQWENTESGLSRLQGNLGVHLQK